MASNRGKFQQLLRKLFQFDCADLDFGIYRWQKPDLERDKEFVADQKLTEGAEDIFVNGDSFIPTARALDPVFKARMFAPVEA